MEQLSSCQLVNIDHTN